MQCDPVRHRVDAKAQAAARPFEHMVIVRPTAFQADTASRTDKRLEFQALYQFLVNDETRNRLICHEIVQAVADGRSPSTIAQYVGRLHRLYDGKREVRVYDYADLNVPMLARMFDRRCRGYEAVGYTIVVPASAIPGWPADVPLPADPLWKRDYAASVRRLVRDGVDVPLANFFVTAARPTPQDIDGANRARSASEAFLYRRLETLPETRRRFQVNVDLPIAFDGWGRMEVDLLCDEARIVIEIDGGQHLADPVAYRRDRRKDQLLQENGYLVLRFLAEDLAKELDSVLDGILRALASRRTTTVTSHALTLVRPSRT